MRRRGEVQVDCVFFARVCVRLIGSLLDFGRLRGQPWPQEGSSQSCDETINSILRCFLISAAIDPFAVRSRSVVHRCPSLEVRERLGAFSSPTRWKHPRDTRPFRVTASGFACTASAASMTTCGRRYRADISCEYCR